MIWYCRFFPGTRVHLRRGKSRNSATRHLDRGLLNTISRYQIQYIFVFRYYWSSPLLLRCLMLLSREEVMPQLCTWWASCWQPHTPTYLRRFPVDIPDFDSLVATPRCYFNVMGFPMHAFSRQLAGLIQDGKA